MNGDTTATERLLEVSNKLWDTMYESGEVPTYKERAQYYLALKDVMDENAKLRERAVAMLSELRGVVSEGDYDSPSGRYFLLRRDVAAYEDALRELGIEMGEWDYEREVVRVMVPADDLDGLIDPETVRLFVGEEGARPGWSR